MNFCSRLFLLLRDPPYRIVSQVPANSLSKYEENEVEGTTRITSGIDKRGKRRKGEREKMRSVDKRKKERERERG